MELEEVVKLLVEREGWENVSSASAATVSSTETQYGWTATRNQILH
jgi:hypothetical protein